MNRIALLVYLCDIVPCRENLCCNVRGARGIIPVASQLAKNVELVILLFEHAGGGVAGIGGGAQLPMSTASTDQVIVSDLPDIGELPFGAEVNVGAEYALILSRLGILDGEPDNPVSAFNSSI